MTPTSASVCHIIDPPPRYYCLVILTEFIGTGTTVEAVIDAAYEQPEDAEFSRAVEKIAVLEESALLGVRSFHVERVVHLDLAARNMIVDRDQVVLVDFGCTQMGLRWTGR